MSADLVALGLGPHEAAALLVVVSRGETTAGEIAATTGLRPPQVSTALSGLHRRGFVERVRDRRPSLVLMSARAAEATARLQLASEEARAAAAARLEAACELLQDAAHQAARRGRPIYELRPASNPTQDSYDLFREGHVSHDEVLHGGAEALRTWRPPRRCSGRLLLVTDAGPALDSFRERVVRAAPRQGVRIRTTPRPVMELTVLDCDRAGIAASGPHGRVRAWSRDPLHVEAARQLFEVWWEDSEPLLELPPVVPAPFDESCLEVDEWDRDELPS